MDLQSLKDAPALINFFFLKIEPTKVLHGVQATSTENDEKYSMSTNQTLLHKLMALRNIPSMTTTLDSALLCIFV